ncbi:MAG: hypothetical protein L6R38_002294 [Xanthoria sp. 2 TBL-2021]|nr:MAG: hypothetical protein L6R38_002294 [Xanthoria sp. 2 TBL-2021]
MPWSEIQPGLYQRPIGENEKFIKLLGDRAHTLGREHWSVTSKAAFDLTQALDEGELVRHCRDAWVALRFEHPSIASRAVDSVLTYQVLNLETLKAWADETFFTHSAKVSKDDLVASLRPSRYVSAHLLLSEPAIVLHFPHWRTDGYGALHLVNAFLDHLSSAINGKWKRLDELPWGEEVHRLVLSIEELLNLPMDATPEVSDLARKYFSTAALARGAVGLETSETVGSETVPRGTRSTSLRFTTAETKTIQKACKSKHIDVRAAVHASCAAVTYAGAALDAQNRPYTSTIRLNLRPYMPPPYDGAAFAAGLCTGGYFEQVPHSQSWSDNAAQSSKAYSVGVTPGFLRSRRQYAKEVLKMLQLKPPAPTPASSEIDISSVGDVEELVSVLHTDNGETVLEVRDVSIGVETLSRQIYCFVWTFRGRLELSLVWNEAFYTAAHSSQLVHNIREVLMTELGILHNGHQAPELKKGAAT